MKPSELHNGILWIEESASKERCPAFRSPNKRLFYPTCERRIVIRKKIKVVPIKPTVSSNVFDKTDIRMGMIERVEDIKVADKLVRLKVDSGDHKRILLAGIKVERQSSKEIEGKHALFVVNLESRKMMGEVSEGMLLDIGYTDGITAMLSVPEIPVPNGSRAG